MYVCVRVHVHIYVRVYVCTACHTEGHIQADVWYSHAAPESSQVVVGSLTLDHTGEGQRVELGDLK